MRDTPETRAKVGGLLGSPPPGARVLVIERFDAVPPEERVGQVLDHLMADESADGSREHPGRRVSWRAADGRNLVQMEVHPVLPDFESALLPHALRAVAGRELAVELWCDPKTLLDGARGVERWEGTNVLRREGPPATADPYRAAAPDPKEARAAEALARAGLAVGREGEAVTVAYEATTPAKPWLLLLLPLALPLVPLALVFAGFREALGDFFRASVTTRRFRASYRVGADELVARIERPGGDARDVRVPLAQAVAVSWAPSGTRVGPDVRGLLRVVTPDGTVSVPLPPELSLEASRAVGAALRDAVESALARRA